MKIKGTGINDFCGNKKRKSRKNNFYVEAVITFAWNFILALGFFVLILFIFRVI